MAEKVGTVRDGLALRVLSATLMVPSGLFVVWWGDWVLAAAIVICGTLMFREFTNIAFKNLSWRITTLGTLTVIFAMGFGLLDQWDHALLALGSGFVAFAVVALFRGRRTVPSSYLGWLIIGAATLSLLYIREGAANGVWLSLAVMVLVWSSDIAAYFAGRGFGGPQLAPQGSPNKTWSGAAGAFVCTGLVGSLFSALWGGNLIVGFGFGFVISAIAQVGDLAQSRWKRTHGTKDSGTLIPGHGGLLDRLDSFSFVLIAVSIMHALFPENIETNLWPVQ